jgi:hypothetical protein
MGPRPLAAGTVVDMTTSSEQEQAIDALVAYAEG